MSWFKVDDKLWGHPKWLSLSKGAKALWITAGSWCASNETDGHIPRTALRPLGGTPREANELTTTKLWEPTPTGWVFHNWATFQPTHAQLTERRTTTRQRVENWRTRNTVTPTVTNGAPDPTRPVLQKVGGGGHLSSDPPTPTPELPEPWRCKDHQGIDVPCLACKAAKAKHRQDEIDMERGKRDAAELARARRAACQDCDSDGWVIGTNPVIRCQHPQLTDAMSATTKEEA